jgi:hypothetical protein
MLSDIAVPELRLHLGRVCFLLAVVEKLRLST